MKFSKMFSIIPSISRYAEDTQVKLNRLLHHLASILQNSITFSDSIYVLLINDELTMDNGYSVLMLHIISYTKFLKI